MNGNFRLPEGSIWEGEMMAEKTDVRKFLSRGINAPERALAEGSTRENSGLRLDFLLRELERNGDGF